MQRRLLGGGDLKEEMRVSVAARTILPTQNWSRESVLSKPETFSHY